MDGTESLDDVLEHFGVKGMKWGVRKDKGHEGERVKLKKLPKLDKKWEQQFQGIAGWAKINNLAADYLNGPNGQFAKLKNRPEYKGKIEKASSNSPLYKKYLADGAKEVNKAWAKVAKDMGVNPSGTQRLKTVIDRESGLAYYKMEDVKHASMDEDAVMVAKLDSDGLPFEILRMGEDGEFMHFGIKGMRWGQRKVRPMSVDARQKATVKERVKKDKVGAVTNKQLQTAIKRMQLEQDFKRLSINEKSGISRWIASTLTEIGKREVQAYAAKKLTVAAIKKVATAGVA